MRVLIWFGIKWPEKGWYAVKQNNQQTNNITHNLMNLSNRKHIQNLLQFADMLL